MKNAHWTDGKLVSSLRKNSFHTEADLLGIFREIAGPELAKESPAMQFVRVVILIAAAVGAAWPAVAQSQYTGDGTPTGLEEEIRWKLNRGIFDSVSENLTRGTAYTDVPASSGPLAPNQSVTMAAPNL